MKIKNYSKSGVNRIYIKFGNEKIRFNLWDELKIDERKIEHELKTQPSYYAFLTMLHKKLLTQFETLKLQRRKLAATLFLKAKESTHQGRPLNDEMCKAKVEKNPKYLALCEQCIKAKDDADSVFAAVRGFEQRKDNLQTLSANRRQENR